MYAQQQKEMDLNKFRELVYQINNDELSSQDICERWYNNCYPVPMDKLDEFYQIISTLNHEKFTNACIEIHAKIFDVLDNFIELFNSNKGVKHIPYEELVYRVWFWNIKGLFNDSNKFSNKYMAEQLNKRLEKLDDKKLINILNKIDNTIQPFTTESGIELNLNTTNENWRIAFFTAKNREEYNKIYKYLKQIDENKLNTVMEEIKKVQWWKNNNQGNTWEQVPECSHCNQLSYNTTQFYNPGYFGWLTRKIGK